METTELVNVMTKYERISVILSIIAIIISVSVPFVQWLYKEKRKAVLKYYPTGRAFLYTNRSGSYLRLDGVFEALKKPISLKKISISITRDKDDKKLKLEWLKFYSPTTQNLMGMQASAEELAHPFRIDADHVTCAFIEFFDPVESAGKAIRPEHEKLVEECNRIKATEPDFKTALAKLINTETYRRARSAIEKELFWEIGKMKAVISASFENRSETFTVEFSVSENQYAMLISGIDEICVFDKQISATKLVNEAIRNDIELTNNVKYDLDIVHGEVLAVKEQTKKAEKKTKVSKKKKVDDTDSSTVSTREDLEQL